MYMGVILMIAMMMVQLMSAPHVYGGDPFTVKQADFPSECSPCIWG